FGIHVILGSQTLGGAYTLAKSTVGQMAVRIALQCNEADSYLILSDDNAAARLLSRPGEAIYNDMSGQIEGNNPFQVVWLPREVQEDRLRAIADRAAKEGLLPKELPVVFEGNVPSDIRNNRALVELAAKGPRAASPALKVWLGEPNAIKGPTEVAFAPHAGSNLLIVGQQADSAAALCCSALISLAAAAPPGALRVRIMDGTPAGSAARDMLARTIAAFPHDMAIVEYRDASKTVLETAALLKARREGSADRNMRFFLAVLGLQRFRALREDEDLGFQAGGGGEESPARSFGEILAEGPGEGIHSIIWCDTLGNLNRTISRRMLREFEARVLFQMSATDSSELADTPAANRLGLYNAILFTQHDGAIEKFRPYAPPDAAFLEDIGRAVRARSGAAGR
ncbi:MAG: hypothetical protein N3A38_12525, partial [Planctomycetota bacterium]|nr:hypothetical protein [Planctomycetota bacterium]